MTEKAVKSLNRFCERVAELEALGYQVLSYEPHPAGGYDFMVVSHRYASDRKSK